MSPNIPYALILALGTFVTSFGLVDTQERIYEGHLSVVKSSEIVEELRPRFIALTANTQHWRRVRLESANSTQPQVISIVPDCHQSLNWRVTYASRSNAVLSPGSKQKVAVVDPDTGSTAFLKAWRSDDKRRSQRQVVSHQRITQIASFVAPKFHRGVYIIDLAADRNGIVTIIEQPQGSPSLHMPANRRISVTWLRQRRVRVGWTSVVDPERLAQGLADDRAGKYCLTLTRDSPSRQYCETQQAHKQGTLLTDVCFHQPTGGTIERDIDLPASAFLNVFAIDESTNTSHRYGATRFGTRLTDEHAMLLGYGKTVHCHIKPREHYKLLVYEAKSPGKNIRFSFFACSGAVSINIARDGKLMHYRGLVEHHHTVAIESKGTGSYYVTLGLKSRRAADVRVIVTGKRKLPYPSQLTLRQVREWSFLRTCQSVTVSWIALQGKHQYCIYLSSQPITRQRRKRESVCALNRDIAGQRQVKCVVRKPKLTSDIIMTEVIAPLRECSQYTIHIYVMKKRFNSDLFAYQPLTIKTSCDQCSSHSSNNRQTSKG